MSWFDTATIKTDMTNIPKLCIRTIDSEVALANFHVDA